jgi:thiol-disulfide isomerase/thioredoxin
MKLKKVLALIPLLIACIGLNPLLSQNAYEIDIKLGQNTDTTFFLSNYFADKFYITDTSTQYVGRAVFTGPEALKEGIYVLANKKKEKVFEFVVGKEQHFKIAAGIGNDPSAVVVEGSLDNSLFFEHIQFVNHAYGQIQELDIQLKKSDIQTVDKETLQKKLDSLNISIINFRKSITDQYPDLLFGKVLLAMQDPIVPEALRSNQEATYLYYKSKFWDNFDLSDERLLLTPILPMKLKTYFEKLVLPDADSIIIEVDRLMAKASTSEKMTEYLIWHFVADYQTPKIMGLDKVFVHLVDQYFVTKKIKNTTPSVEEQLLERANKMRNSLLGMKAPEMWLVDTTDNFRSFREIDKPFTVLIFWDQTCGHCKKEMETLYDLHQTGAYDFGVYAINSTNDFDGWKKYIREKKHPWLHVNGTKSMTADYHDLYDIYSVPVIYLLDKNKTIIGKRIGAEHLSKVIDNYMLTHSKE